MAEPAHAPRAVLLDALGTLVDLDDPVGGLLQALRARGVETDPHAVGAALQVEIAHYRAEHQIAVDAASLAQLRRGCARVFGEALGAPAAALAPQDLHDALLEGLRFRAFDDVAPALAALRARGARLAVVSNWDVSLHEVLATTGLAAGVDIVLTSAQERTRKPAPELFRRALERLGGIDPADALHVGDDLVADVGGARAAGIEPVLIDRAGAGGPADGARVIRTLAELPGAGVLRRSG
jgi:putative hydrolase of the HAD superfamily